MRSSIQTPLFAWSCLFVVPGAEAGTQSAVKTARFEVDGVSVVHRNDPSSQAVATRLYLLGGVQSPVAGSHDVERLWLQAAEHAAEGALARAGARPLVAASPDWSATGSVTLRQHWNEAWLVWATSIGEPTAWLTGCECARATTLSAARQRARDPAEEVQALVQRTTFRDHPYSPDIWGTPETLERVTEQDALRTSRREPLQLRPSISTTLRKLTRTSSR